MSTERAIRTALYDRLTTDARLQTALGGIVRIHHVFPDEAEPVLPYLVHALSVASGPDAVVGPATYSLDIWDLNDTSDRVDDAAAAIIVSLDELLLALPGNEVMGLRFWVAQHGFIPMEEPGIWRYSIRLSVRWARALELTEILTRP